MKKIILVLSLITLLSSCNNNVNSNDSSLNEISYKTYINEDYALRLYDDNSFDLFKNDDVVINGSYTLNDNSGLLNCKYSINYTYTFSIKESSFSSAIIYANDHSSISNSYWTYINENTSSSQIVMTQYFAKVTLLDNGVYNIYKSQSFCFEDIVAIQSGFYTINDNLIILDNNNTYIKVNNNYLYKYTADLDLKAIEDNIYSYVSFDNKRTMQVEENVTFDNVTGFYWSYMKNGIKDINENELITITYCSGCSTYGSFIYTDFIKNNNSFYIKQLDLYLYF